MSKHRSRLFFMINSMLEDPTRMQAIASSFISAPDLDKKTLYVTGFPTDQWEVLEQYARHSVQGLIRFKAYESFAKLTFQNGSCSRDFLDKFHDKEYSFNTGAFRLNVFSQVDKSNVFDLNLFDAPRGKIVSASDAEYFARYIVTDNEDPDIFIAIRAKAFRDKEDPRRRIIPGEKHWTVFAIYSSGGNDSLVTEYETEEQLNNFLFTLAGKERRLKGFEHSVLFLDNQSIKPIRPYFNPPRVSTDEQIRVERFAVKIGAIKPDLRTLEELNEDRKSSGRPLLKANGEIQKPKIEIPKANRGENPAEFLSRVFTDPKFKRAIQRSKLPPDPAKLKVEPPVYKPIVRAANKNSTIVSEEFAKDTLRGFDHSIGVARDGFDGNEIKPVIAQPSTIEIAHEFNK